jgi:hypothetical protein
MVKSRRLLLAACLNYIQQRSDGLQYGCDDSGTSGDPTDINSFPFFFTMVGVMELNILFSGASSLHYLVQTFGTPAFALKSSISLFKKIPRHRTIF